MVTLLQDADLHLPDDNRAQRREWAVERVAWVGAGLVLLAAALGALGGGPLSGARASAGGVTVHYERLARRERPIEVTIHLEAGPPGAVLVALRGSYFQDAEIQSIRPRPSREIALSDGVRYLLDVPPGEPASVSLILTPQRAGRSAGTVEAQQQSLPVSMFVYP